ncbi:MAG: glycerate kinase, partial [Acidimicrobiales bacterium]
SAGGLAGGLASAGATLRPGFEVVAEIVGFDEKLARADAVLTGEGRLDAGSFGGKVVCCVLGAARRLPSPPRLLCVAGEVGHRGLMPGLQELATIADLSARFGGERSRREPALLTAIVVEEWLSSPP